MTEPNSSPNYLAQYLGMISAACVTFIFGAVIAAWQTGRLNASPIVVIILATALLAIVLFALGLWSMQHGRDKATNEQSSPIQTDRQGSAAIALRTAWMTAVTLVLLMLVVDAIFKTTQPTAPVVDKLPTATQQVARPEPVVDEAQWQIAEWTMYGGIAMLIGLPISALGILFVYRNLRVAVQLSQTSATTLTETRDTRREELRAYVYVDGGEAVDKDGLLEYRLFVKNAGRTPTTWSEISRRIHVSFDGEISRAKDQHLALPNLAPGQMITYAALLSSERRNEIEGRLAANGSYDPAKGVWETYPVVSGTIDYRDIYHRKQVTVFRLQLPTKDHALIEGPLVSRSQPNWMS